MNDQKLIARLKEFLNGATVRAIYQSRGANIDDKESFADSYNRFIEQHHLSRVNLPRFDHKCDDIELFAMDLGAFISEVESGKIDLRA
jgi:hypothetical protein